MLQGKDYQLDADNNKTFIGDRIAFCAVGYSTLRMAIVARISANGVGYNGVVDVTTGRTEKKSRQRDQFVKLD
jgi:hypothetical protein